MVYLPLDYTDMHAVKSIFEMMENFAVVWAAHPIDPIDHIDQTFVTFDVPAFSPFL